MKFKKNKKKQHQGGNVHLSQTTWHYHLSPTTKMRKLQFKSKKKSPNKKQCHQEREEILVLTITRKNKLKLTFTK